MAELENILVASDGSKFSEGAIREAIKLANVCTSKLYFMSVLETNPEFEALAPDLVEKKGKEVRKHLEELKARAAKEGRDSELIGTCSEDVYKCIVNEAAKVNASLIVMGRRGRRGLKRLMMGSVTAMVIGQSPTNVLVVPQAAEMTCKHILIATDGSVNSENGAREGMSIAKRYGSSIIAMSVARKEDDMSAAEENVRYVKDLADKEGIPCETIAIQGTPYEAITTTAKVKGADLIVVGSHGKTGLKTLLMGGVAERIIGLAECTVLVVK